MFKIAVLISGSGSDLQSVIDAIDSGYIKGEIEAVISDKADAYGLERARNKNIKTYSLDKKQYCDGLSDEILRILKGKVDLIVLAGFLSILKGDIIKEFKDRIINIHPSLIPSFCGPKMYGLKVHQAAIDYGVKVSGCTVHFVDDGTDTGAIILQNTAPVYSEDTAETLQKRVLAQEHLALPEAVKLISESRVIIHNRKVIIVKADCC